MDRGGSCYSDYLRLYGDLQAASCQYQPKFFESLEPLQQGQLSVGTSNAEWQETPRGGNVL